MKLFEEFKKCTIILHEVIQEDKFLEFKNWIESNDIKRYKSNVTITGYNIVKYVGGMIELNTMVKEWFHNPDLYNNIKCD